MNPIKHRALCEYRNWRRFAKSHKHDLVMRRFAIERALFWRCYARQVEGK